MKNGFGNRLKTVYQLSISQLFWMETDDGLQLKNLTRGLGTSKVQKPLKTSWTGALNLMSNSLPSTPSQPRTLPVTHRKFKKSWQSQTRNSANSYATNVFTKTRYMSR